MQFSVSCAVFENKIDLFKWTYRKNNRQTISIVPWANEKAQLASDDLRMTTSLPNMEGRFCWNVLRKNPLRQSDFVHIRWSARLCCDTFPWVFRHHEPPYFACLVKGRPERPPSEWEPFGRAGKKAISCDRNRRIGNLRHHCCFACNVIRLLGPNRTHRATLTDSRVVAFIVSLHHEHKITV